MRVAGAGDILGARVEFHRQHGLGDHVGGARPENVYAEHAVRLRIGDDLDEPVPLFHRPHAAVGEERKLADLHLEVLFLALLFGETDGREFRPRVDDRRNRRVVDVSGLSGEQLDAGDPLFLRLVREHRAGDDVTDRVDTGDRSLEVLVNLYPTFRVELDARRLETEPGRVGTPADRDEHLVEALGRGLAAGFDLGARFAARGDGHALRARRKLERDSLLLEDLLQR